jgi:hypothetical protein
MNDAQACPICAAVTEPHAYEPRMRSYGAGGEQGQVPAQQPSHASQFGLYRCSAGHEFRVEVPKP